MIYELIYECNIIAEDVIMNKFNSVDVYNNRLYVNISYDTYINPVLERHGWNDQGKK